MKRLLPFLALVAACSSAEHTPDPVIEDLDSGVVTDTSTSTVTDTATAATDSASEFDVPPADTSSSCVPTETRETLCNGKDDDCNGAIDDVDLGKDGICDCLGILILGNSGSKPASSFEKWLKDRGTATKRRLDSTGPSLGAAELTGIDVVVLDRLSRDYTPSEIEVLQNFVKGGGGLIAMTGYDYSGADASRPNLIIKGLGAMYNDMIKMSTPVNSWDATHPIAKGMTSVTFAGGYGVATTSGYKTATTVGRSSSNAAAIAVEVGSGRMFVWGDEWIEYDSEWASIPEIPKLWANIFGWVVQNRCAVSSIK